MGYPWNEFDLTLKHKYKNTVGRLIKSATSIYKPTNRIILTFSFLSELPSGIPCLYVVALAGRESTQIAGSGRQNGAQWS